MNDEFRMQNEELKADAKRAGRSSGGRGMPMQSLGNQCPSGFVGLCWTFQFKKFCGQPRAIMAARLKAEF